ncbi:MAG: ACT domain-containing protein [Bdellovibrionales bacterium]
MKIVLTIIGKDCIGIVAAVSTALAERRVNIMDMNQNIMNGFFNMVMIADMESSTVSLGELQDSMRAVGEKLGLQIKVQSEEIFNAMHTV